METRFIEVEGRRLRIRDSGGPGLPVLLSSGIGASLEFFAAQFAALGAAHRLIAWDYPGHGLSDDGDGDHDPDRLARTALALLSALGIERAVLVGNSLGGTIAIRAAALAPDRVAAMLLISPAMTGAEVFFPFRLMTLPLLGELMNKPNDKSIEMQLKTLFHKDFTPPQALRDIVRRNVMRAGAAAPFLRTMRQTLTLRGVRPEVWRKSRAQLAAVTCPVLFVHGRDDVVLPVKQSIEAQALTPGAEIEIFESCGHTAQVEQADKLNATLSRFLRAQDAR